MKNIDELLHSLRENGTIDSEGSFTVSLSEARRKLTDFHSSDKERYLILLVSGGIAAKASEITVAPCEFGIKLVFKRAYLPEAALLGAFEGHQESEYSEAATDFVLGLRAAFTNNVEKIKLEVSHFSQPNYLWEMLPQSEASLARERSDTEPGITVSLYTGSNLFGNVRAFFRRLRGHVGMPSEVKLLDKYCDHSLVPIFYQDQPLHRPYFSPRAQRHAVVGNLPESFPKPSPASEVWQEKWRGVLSLVPGKVQIVIHGVAYSQIDSPHFTGLIHHHTLKRDLSREKIVRDSEFQTFLEELDRIEDRLYEDLALGLDEINDSSHNGYMTELVVRFLTFRLSPKARESTWNWMTRAMARLYPQIPADSYAANSQSLMLCYEQLHPAADSQDEILRKILDFCSEALVAQNPKSLQLLKIAEQLFRNREGDNSLIRGYLQLGLGALQHRTGLAKLGDASWFKALQIVWTGTDDRAQELIYLHMDLGVEHMIEQVATALRMYIEDL